MNKFVGKNRMTFTISDEMVEALDLIRQESVQPFDNPIGRSELVRTLIAEGLRARLKKREQANGTG